MGSDREIMRLKTPSLLHGEGPIWHSGRETAFWVDILSGVILEYDPISTNYKTYKCNPMVSAIFQCEGDNENLIVAVAAGIGIYNLELQELTIKTDLNIDWKDVRCNDGAIDCEGDLWIGTTHMDHLKDVGDLYCITKGWNVQKVIPNVTISNGPCWSKDNTKMFHTDSVTRSIIRYHFSREEKQLISEHIVVKIQKNRGFPDGMALDKNGRLWVAIWGDSCVACFDLISGEQVDCIQLPVPQVSSISFIGEKLNMLLITTSKKEMTEKQLEIYPESGCTYLVKMDVSGLETYACRL